MPRVGIQQFREALMDRSHQSGALRAYRKLARHPRRGTQLTDGWIPWGAAAGWAEWPDTGTQSTRQPGADFANWGEWSAPPRGTGTP